MYQKQVEYINKIIDKTGKAIISLGCSFVQGQGAVNDELYTDYTWIFKELGTPLEISLNEAEKKQIVKRYSDLLYTGPDGKVDFTFMEYENAFVNVLCKKYFEEGYAPINLGIRGCGNRASIKDLYFYPEINWGKVKEFIVIYVPSGLERFDFVNDMWSDHHHWKCMWPHWKDVTPGPRQNLWKGYSEHMHSEKFEVFEQISHVQELMTWCKLHNAKLIITPGFDRRYNKKYFEKTMLKTYTRDIEGNLIDTGNIFLNKERITRFADLFPWENMFMPDECPTFIDLVMKEEHPKDWSKIHFFDYLGKGSPNGWVTSCAHPSAKGHDLFAKKIFEYIKGI